MYTDNEYKELPRQCIDWDRFMFGDGPMIAARATPDQWIAAFELTAAEFIKVAFGFRLQSFRHTPQAIRFDSVSGRYLAWSLRQLPASVVLPSVPSAADVWATLLGPWLWNRLHPQEAQ